MMFDGLGLQTISYVSTNPTIVAGNTADESSLVLLALSVVNENRARLYNVQNFPKINPKILRSPLKKENIRQLISFILFQKSVSDKLTPISTKFDSGLFKFCTIEGIITRLSRKINCFIIKFKGGLEELRKRAPYCLCC